MFGLIVSCVLSAQPALIVEIPDRPTQTVLVPAEVIIERPAPVAKAVVVAGKAVKATAKAAAVATKETAKAVVGPPRCANGQCTRTPYARMRKRR